MSSSESEDDINVRKPRRRKLQPRQVTASKTHKRVTNMTIMRRARGKSKIKSKIDRLLDSDDSDEDIALIPAARPVARPAAAASSIAASRPIQSVVRASSAVAAPVVNVARSILSGFANFGNALLNAAVQDAT